jgi:hypothetical protein
LNKVVLGKVHNVSAFAAVSSCPRGCQSVSVEYILGQAVWSDGVVQVVFDRNNGTLNETIVYTNDAVRPVFLIIFG